MTQTSPTTAADRLIDRWHAYMKADDPVLLDALLADDVVFESPVVHTPQVGKAVTTAYLRAAAEVLGNESFRYLNEWRADGSVVLEFACELDGVTVNGVDIITWRQAEGGGDERITHFKVMVRPLKAIGAVRERMAARLAKAG